MHMCAMRESNDSERKTRAHEPGANACKRKYPYFGYTAPRNAVLSDTSKLYKTPSTHKQHFALQMRSYTQTFKKKHDHAYPCCEQFINCMDGRFFFC